MAEASARLQGPTERAAWHLLQEGTSKWEELTRWERVVVSLVPGMRSETLGRSGRQPRTRPCCIPLIAGSFDTLLTPLLTSAVL